MKRWSALLVAWLVGLSGVWLVGQRTTPEAAEAAVVSTQACRPGNPNLRQGVCHRFPDGRVTWLGTLANPRGKVFFCLDKNLDSRLPSTAPVVSTRGLRNQFGTRVGPAEVAALNYVITAWGHRAGRVDAAAISLIIRQVMGDTRGQFPSGLTVTRTVKPIAGGLPAPILARARFMWSQASAMRGPWRVQLSGSTANLSVGSTRTLAVNVWSAANRRVAARVSLTATGTRTTSLTTNRTKSALVSLTASRAGLLSVSAAVTGPAQNGRLFDPSRRRVQRGWIAGSSRSRAALELRAVVARLTPRVSTQVSAQEAVVGSRIRDTVTVTGLAGRTVTTPIRITWALLGPLPPVNGSCAGLNWARAPRITGGAFSVTRDGTLVTPHHTLTAAGCHSYTESVVATASVQGHVHPPGLVPQTTRAFHEPTLATQTSNQRVAVGARLTDRVTVTGLAPGVGGTVQWRLVGPVPPRNGSCADLTWGNARTHDAGALAVTGNGTWTTPPARVITAPGCYTYAESMPATGLTSAAEHAPGQVTQTTLTFRYTPSVRTTVSRQRARVGHRLRDRVEVSGLRPGSRARVDWHLLGPRKPVHGTCARVRWAGAPVHDRGTITVGNGAAWTRASKPLRRAGCYTYGERLVTTVDTLGVWHAAGQRSQTTLVHRPRRPRVPTGW